MEELPERYVAEQIKAIYDECELAQHRGTEKEVISAIDQYFTHLWDTVNNKYEGRPALKANLAHSELQSLEYPKEKVQAIKLGCLSLASILEIDTNKFRDPPEGASFMKVDNRTNVNQSTIVNMNVDNIIDFVNETHITESERDEVIQKLEEFREEIERGEPDKSKISQMVNDMKDQMPSVAAKMGILALQKGVVEVLS